MKGWTQFTHFNLLSACRHMQMYVCGSPCMTTCWFLLIPVEAGFTGGQYVFGEIAHYHPA